MMIPVVHELYLVLPVCNPCPHDVQRIVFAANYYLLDNSPELRAPAVVTRPRYVNGSTQCTGFSMFWSSDLS